MTNNNQEMDKKQSVKSLPIIPGVIIMGVAILVLATIVYVIFAYVGFVDPPDFLANILFGETKKEVETSELLNDLQKRINASSQSFEFGVSGNIIDWNDVTIEDICDTSYTGSYYQTGTVSYNGSKNKNEYSVLVSKEENTVKYLVTSGSDKGKSVINDSKNVTVSYKDYEKKYELSVYEEDGLYFENEVGCPSIRQLKDKIDMLPQNGYSIQFEENEDKTIFRITFVNYLTDIKEVYEVKGGLGLILSANFYQEDSITPYYSFNTTNLMVGVFN